MQKKIALVDAEKISWILFYTLLAIYLVGSINFEPIYELNWHDQQRVGQFFLLPMVWAGCIFLFRRTHSLFPMYSRSTTMALLVFVALGFVSALQAEYPRWAFLEWAVFLLLLMSIGLIAEVRILRGTEFDKYLLHILLLACVIYTMGFCGRYAALSQGAMFEVQQFFNGFVNQRFFGHLQTITLPMFAIFIYRASAFPKKFFFISLLSIWWMLAFASGTRATWLAMACVIVVTCLLFSRIGRALALYQIVAASLGLVIYVFLFYLLPEWLNFSLSIDNRLSNILGLSAREVLWQRSLEIVVVSPWLGNGPMHFGLSSLNLGGNPHNALLQLASEWGLIATILLSAVSVTGLYKFGKLSYLFTKSGQAPVLQIALFGALVGIAVQSMVDGVIVMPYTQILLVVIIGWAIGVYYTMKDKTVVNSAPLHSSQKSCWFNRCIVGCFCMLYAIALFNAWPEMMRLDERERSYAEKNGGQFSPRFWRQGRINPYWD